MVCWLAGDVRVTAVGEIHPLYEVPIGKELEEAEDGGAPNAKLALLGISEEVGGGEVPLPPRDEGGEFTARPGQANPRLVKRLEQLWCHGGIVPVLRLSLNTAWWAVGAWIEGYGACTGMIRS